MLLFKLAIPMHILYTDQSSSDIRDTMMQICRDSSCHAIDNTNYAVSKTIIELEGEHSMSLDSVQSFFPHHLRWYSNFQLLYVIALVSMHFGLTVGWY